MSYLTFLALNRSKLACCVLAAAMTAGCGDVLINTRETRNAGIKQYDAGSYAEAAATFRSVTRANPADYGSHYFLGASLAKMGSYEQAIEQYKTCLELMNIDMVGREDKPFRLQAMDSLAAAVVASKDHDFSTITVKGSPASDNQFLLAKINRGLGDADAAVDAYTQAALLVPHDFDIAKEFGLYLLQLSQNDHARAELRRAYALNTRDMQVANALRRVGVVPGPSLKDDKDMAKPIIPVGPIPEMDTAAPAAASADPAQAPRTNAGE